MIDIDIQKSNFESFLKSKGWKQASTEVWVDPLDGKLYYLRQALEIQRNRI